MGVTTLLVGGIGEVGRSNFQRLGIAVSTGHSGSEPENLIADYLTSPAQPKANPCANFEHRHHHCRGGPPAGKR
jgi:predicted Fe-Mo cluster-binding NifX family protein